MFTTIVLCGGWLCGMPPDGIGAAAPRSESHKDALANYGAALWNLRRDRLLSAAKQLEDAARQDPAALAPKRELVRLYAQLGRELEAIRLAQSLLDADPHDADTAHLLAKLLADAGELKEAMAAAQLAAASPRLSDRPDKALAIFRDAATLCERAGDRNAAVRALQRAVRLLTEDRKAVLASGLYAPREVDAELADTHERLGKLFAKQGQFAEAAAAFQSAHALYSDPLRAADPHAAARLDWNISGVAAARSDPAAAVLHLERFLSLRPQAAEPYERYVAQLRLAGRAEQVVPKLRALLDRDRENRYLLAVLAAELARDPASREEAERHFAALAAATNDASIVRIAVRSRIETLQPRRILDELDAADAAAHDDALGPVPQAFAAERLRTFAEVLKADAAAAFAVFDAAAADLRAGTRRRSATWHLLGWLAVRHRKLEIAVSQYRVATRNAPLDTEMDAYVGLIETLWRLRRPAEVAATCREGLVAARTVPPVYFNYHLSLALAELGEAETALIAADAAIKQAGDAARLEARLRKLYVLETLGRDAEAVALGQALLGEFEARSDRLRIRSVLASAYYSAGKYREWEAELRTILDADPDHAGACNNLGYHLADQGRNLDEAEQLVRRALLVDRIARRRAGDPDPESASYLDSLGWVLFRKGRLAEARQHIERALTMPDGAASGEIWDHLGDVCFRSGDKAAAKTAWASAATAYATDARAKRRGRADEVQRKLALVK